MDHETRELLREVAEALDALVVALQTEMRGAAHGLEPGYGLQEAIRRVNRFREHVDEVLVQGHLERWEP